MSERPGRYQRSVSGMVGALLVLLLVIGAFVAFRALNREEIEAEPERVDYRAAVEVVQAEGREVVYPGAVPDTWRATSLEAQPRGPWRIGFLTPGGFAGVVQRDAPVEEMLETYVDAETSQRDPVEVTGSVAGTWRVFEDDGGDLAYLAEVGEERVLVYGSAPAEELELLVGALTMEPLGPR